MLRIPPPLRPPGRRFKPSAANPPSPPPPPPPPGPPVLLSASFDGEGPSVTMVFDRAIDIAGIDLTLVRVDDGSFTHLLYDGEGGATLLDPMTLRVVLNPMEENHGPGVHLQVIGGAGIVSAGEEPQPWGGESYLELPYP